MGLPSANGRWRERGSERVEWEWNAGERLNQIERERDKEKGEMGAKEMGVGAERQARN